MLSTNDCELNIICTSLHSFIPVYYLFIFYHARDRIEWWTKNIPGCTKSESWKNLSSKVRAVFKSALVDNVIYYGKKELRGRPFFTWNFSTGKTMKRILGRSFFAIGIGMRWEDPINMYRTLWLAFFGLRHYIVMVTWLLIDHREYKCNRREYLLLCLTSKQIFKEFYSKNYKIF